MSRVGPFGTAPQLVERKARLVDMMVRDQSNVGALQFWGAPTLNDAYGDPTGITGNSLVSGAGPETLFAVNRSQQFRSASVVRRRGSWYGEALRGMSRVAWDPSDYVDPATSHPSDTEYGFVRVQESRLSAGGLSAATGWADLNATAATDTVVIAGVSFLAVAIPGVPAGQTFDASSGVPTAVAELIATVNDPASQALILAAAPAGVTVTASAGPGPGFVLLTASVGGAQGELVTLLGPGATVVSGAALAGGGAFLTVQGVENHGDPKLGPIYVVPTPEFFGTSVPTLTLQGTAPANTGCTAGSVPLIHEDIQDPNPMHIVLPRSTSSISITNLADPAGTDTLLISTGLGSTMASVGPTDDPATVFGAFKDIVVAGVGAVAVPFSIYAVVALGGVA